MKHVVSFGNAAWLCLLGVIVACIVASMVYGEIERRAIRWYNTNHPILPKQPKPWVVKAYEFLNQ